MVVVVVVVGDVGGCASPNGERARARCFPIGTQGTCAYVQRPAAVWLRMPRRREFYQRSRISRKEGAPVPFTDSELVHVVVNSLLAHYAVLFLSIPPMIAVVALAKSTTCANH